MHLSVATRELHPRHAFRIARARRNAVCNVFLRLEHDGFSGYGEASPNSFYGETASGVVDKLESIRPILQSLAIREAGDVARAWADLWPALQPSRAAQCAVDLALWDWLGKASGRSVADLVWKEPPHPITTFATVGLSTPEELARKLDELDGFPRIKIKSDAAADLTAARAVREKGDAELAIDANCAWSGRDLSRLAASLADLGIAFIEQPLPPEADSQMNRGQFRVPVIADESCVTEGDVAHVADHFEGFNVKLVKCGGITPALRMLREGRAAGCKLIVGCMLESSLLVAAGAVVAQRTDYADLDGAWLLADDPCNGWLFRGGILDPPGGAGLGVTVPIEMFSGSAES